MDSEKNISKIFKTKAFALLVSDRNGIIVACARGFVLFEIPGKILPTALVLLGAEVYLTHSLVSVGPGDPPQHLHLHPHLFS